MWGRGDLSWQWKYRKMTYYLCWVLSFSDVYLFVRRFRWKWNRFWWRGRAWEKEEPDFKWLILVLLVEDDWVHFQEFPRNEYIAHHEENHVSAVWDISGLISKSRNFKRVHWVRDGWLLGCVRLPPMCSKANMDLVSTNSVSSPGVSTEARNGGLGGGIDLLLFYIL